MARVGQKERRQIRRPPSGIADPLQVGLRPRSGRDRFGCEVCATEDRHQKVVEVVCDSSSEHTQTLELLRLPQLRLQPDLLLLGAHALRYVGRYAEDAVDRSLATPNRGVASFEYPTLKRDRVRETVAPQRAKEIVLDLRIVREQLRRTAPNEVAGLETDGFQSLPLAEGHDTIAIEHEQHDGRVGDEAQQVRLGQRQGLLDALELADVEDHAPAADGPPTRGDHPDRVSHPDDAVVLRDQAVLELVVLPDRGESLAHSQDTIMVLRVEPLRKELRPLEPSLDGKPEESLSRLAHEPELEGVGITLPDHAIETTQQIFVIYSG